MIFTLLSHSWLSFWRSKSLGRSIGVTIFTWLMVALMLLYAVGFGYMLEGLIGKLAPDKDPIKLLNGLLLFYWMFELVFRIIIQKNVTLNVQHYLTQRISRQSLAHFMLVKSWVNLFLLITVLLFSRFAFHKIGVIYSLQQGWVWLLFLLGVSFCLHHLVIFIHQIAKGRIWLPFTLTVIIAALMYGNVFGYIDMLLITEGLMDSVLNNPFVLLAPWLISGGLYLLTHFYIRKNLALDNLPQEISIANEGVPNWVQYLNGKGVIGQLLALELRLIWRNKRARTIIIMAFVMIAYFLAFFLRYDDLNRVFGIITLIATGALMINYGQLLFSWESYYFDYAMTRNYSIADYLKSKFTLLLGFNTISLIISGIAIMLIDRSMILDLVLWYFVNSGIFIYMFIWVGALGAKRIDSNARAIFNYEGLNVTQFLIIIPYFALPSIAKYLIDSNLGEGMGTYILAGVGVLGLLMYNPIISVLSNAFLKRKHKILVRLRE